MLSENDVLSEEVPVTLDARRSIESGGKDGRIAEHIKEAGNRPLCPTIVKLFRSTWMPVSSAKKFEMGTKAEKLGISCRVPWTPQPVIAVRSNSAGEVT